ncbi:hypothetical protein BASA50_003143 [Batrachochytrium salamandrivorans]|uniref:Ribosomal protein S9 n=1 Tax=Batrachochytrium salamandrivorans TaxID=1357716 RepID=A0ABQ8FJA6_9FUNG|nr:hypothetical protein BASA60_011120 [Batrachochytrium salamandrivorans]KAH6581110.1 hypothetical protein BASA61_009233 [Batrachochytrium salamandrivorans]KAH6599257.1 hypothetical protein BASA50_003143 [Batrachochytrium salamandrivorans]KAH9266307.1 hypothetical protein BASA83_010691 [Batrachochytrium salamandrivorans]
MTALLFKQLPARHLAQWSFVSASLGATHHASTRSRNYETASIFNKVSDSMHAFPRPTDPAYFTGNPQYFTLLRQLNALIRKHNIDFKSTPKTTGSWQSLSSMAKSFHMRIRETDYTDLTHRLNLLYSSQDLDPIIKTLLQKFVPIGRTLSQPKTIVRTLDTEGRSYTIGSRKTARAQCWLIPGDGQIYINGIKLHRYFPDLSNRETVVRPFEMTNRLLRFNTWAIVTGGGSTGKADAVAVAVARGIAIHEPKMAEALKDFGMLKIDTRQVERKKTGQPGARKKNTWVRR